MQSVINVWTGHEYRAIVSVRTGTSINVITCHEQSDRQTHRMWSIKGKNMYINLYLGSVWLGFGNK